MYDISLEAFDVKTTAKSIGTKAKDAIKKIVERIKAIISKITSAIDKTNDDKLLKLVHVINKRGLKKELSDKLITVRPILCYNQCEKVKHIGAITVGGNSRNVMDDDFLDRVLKVLDELTSDNPGNITIDVTKNNMDVLRKFGSINLSESKSVTIKDYLTKGDVWCLADDGCPFNKRVREIKKDINLCNNIIKKLESKRYSGFNVTVDDRSYIHENDVPINEFLYELMRTVLVHLKDWMNLTVNNITVIKTFARYIAAKDGSNSVYSPPKPPNADNVKVDDSDFDDDDITLD